MYCYVHDWSKCIDTPPAKADVSPTVSPVWRCARNQDATIRVQQEVSGLKQALPNKEGCT